GGCSLFIPLFLLFCKPSILGLYSPLILLPFFRLLSLNTLPFSLFLFSKLVAGSVNLALSNCNFLLLFVFLFNS
ncbi:hypothetical protein BU23DRAFT_331180, partial [Bimuria novae-zelandiae CBS 107.79]